jgi:hypothetical protein
LCSRIIREGESMMHCPKTVTSSAVPTWKQFEAAIAGYLKHIDPSATVTRDAFTPDRDTPKQIIKSTVRR